MATVILTGTGWIGYRHISAGITRSAALAGEPSSTGPKQNILIMGVDSRRDQHGRPLPQQMYDALHAGDADAGEYDSDALIVLHRARSVATKRAEGTVMFIGALRIGEAHQRGSTLQFVHCERLRVEA